MCSRLSQASPDIIEEEFFGSLTVHEWIPRINIGIGEPAYVVYRAHATDNKRIIQPMQFGYNKAGKFNFNGRAEAFHNKANELDYTGPLGIHKNPSYKDSISTNRCLIPVTSFIEGPEHVGLERPYKISLNNTRQFAIAAIWDIDDKKGFKGFSTLTCWPNRLIKDVIGHHRSPVILHPNYHNDWLNPEIPVEDILTLLRPYSEEFMHIEPISANYKSAKYKVPFEEAPPYTPTTLF